MSPASYQTAPPRVKTIKLTAEAGPVNNPSHLFQPLCSPSFRSRREA
jgi:hypothetical protein